MAWPSPQTTGSRNRRRALAALLASALTASFAPGASAHEKKKPAHASGKAMTDEKPKAEPKAKKVPGGWKLPGEQRSPYNPSVPPDQANPRRPRTDRPDFPQRRT